MTYEVELKFPLDDPERIIAQLAELNAERGTPVVQRDRYFAHPQRDFAQTDEALRLRSVDGENCITYKGPLVDAHTKTRREIEIPFEKGQEAAEKFTELLTLLGFREVHTVVKTRVPYRLDWEGRRLELALDEVIGLGPFLEIETLADESTRAEAADSIWRLARQLGLEHSQRKSYLALLLEKDGARDQRTSPRAGLILFLAALSLGAAALFLRPSRHVAPEPVPLVDKEVEDWVNNTVAAQKLLKEADSLQLSGNSDDARRLYQQVIDDFPEYDEATRAANGLRQRNWWAPQTTKGRPSGSGVSLKRAIEMPVPSPTGQ